MRTQGFLESRNRVNGKTINVGASLGYGTGSNPQVTGGPQMAYSLKYMQFKVLLLIISLLSAVATAMPNDFAGLKLGQNLGASKKFLLELGHNIIYPDGKILWSKGEKTFNPADLQKTISGESKSGQLCTVSFDPLSPKTKHPHIQTFNCGVVNSKDINPDRVVDTFIISHFMTDNSDKAFYLTYMFNLDTAKPTGAGLVGKLGEPDTIDAGQTCPGFVKAELKLKGKDLNGCFVAMWLPAGSAVMATAVGFGVSLRKGKVGRLEIWDMESQKKVESFKASKAAEDLGF